MILRVVQYTLSNCHTKNDTNSFTNIEQTVKSLFLYNYFYIRLVDTTFWRETKITTITKMAKILSREPRMTEISNNQVGFVYFIFWSGFLASTTRLQRLLLCCLESRTRNCSPTMQLHLSTSLLHLSTAAAAESAAAVDV